MNEPRHIERRHITPGDYEVPDHLAAGVYSTMAAVVTSGPDGKPEEITLDFLYAGRGMSRPRLVGRIILSPRHALRLHNTLKANLKNVFPEEIS